MPTTDAPPGVGGSLLDHLEEVRRRLFWVAGAGLLGTVVGWVLVERYRALRILFAPLREAYGEDFRLIYLSPTDPFFVTLKLAALVGALVAAPVALFHLRAFLRKRMDRGGVGILPVILFAVLLFAAGVALAYFLAIPLSLAFLQGFQTEYLEGMMEVQATLGFVMGLMLVFGLVFELPVVVMVLSSLGIVNPTFLRKKRRHAFVLALVVSSILSPGDVMVVTILLMVPLVLLYEVSILLSAVISRKRMAAAGENHGLPDSMGAAEGRG